MPKIDELVQEESEDDFDRGVECVGCRMRESGKCILCQLKEETVQPSGLKVPKGNKPEQISKLNISDVELESADEEEQKVSVLDISKDSQPESDIASTERKLFKKNRFGNA